LLKQIRQEIAYPNCCGHPFTAAKLGKTQKG
jgi:hypothetical protein